MVFLASSFYIFSSNSREDGVDGRKGDYEDFLRKQRLVLEAGGQAGGACWPISWPSFGAEYPWRGA